MLGLCCVEYDGSHERVPSTMSPVWLMVGDCSMAAAGEYDSCRRHTGALQNCARTGGGRGGGGRIGGTGCVSTREKVEEQLGKQGRISTR